MTPSDPGWIFNVITFVEGVKVMHMHKSRVKCYAFCRTWCLFGENDLFDPSDPIMTSDPIIVCAWVVVQVSVTVTKFGQNQMSGSMWKRRVARKKKERKKELDICCRHRRRTLPGWPQEWPQIDIWSTNKDGGSQADAHVWVYMVMLCIMDELKHF